MSTNYAIHDLAQFQPVTKINPAQRRERPGSPIFAIDFSPLFW
jgi:hypothetical protein